MDKVNTLRIAKQRHADNLGPGHHELLIVLHLEGTTSRILISEIICFLICLILPYIGFLLVEAKPS